MSVVLCLPAHLCVSPQRPVAGPPRERVKITHEERAERLVANMKSIQKLCAWQPSANDEKLSKVVCGVVFTKGECTRLCKGQPRANGLVCDINFHVLKTPDRVAPPANGLVCDINVYI